MDRCPSRLKRLRLILLEKELSTLRLKPPEKGKIGTVRSRKNEIPQKGKRVRVTSKSSRRFL